MPVTCDASRYIMILDICDMKCLKVFSGLPEYHVHFLPTFFKAPDGSDVSLRNLVSASRRMVLHIGLVVGTIDRDHMLNLT